MSDEEEKQKSYGLDIEAIQQRLARERERRTAPPPARNELTDAMQARLARERAQGPKRPRGRVRYDRVRGERHR